jgi:L-threonylcarbamoyladenylate synthase
MAWRDEADLRARWPRAAWAGTHVIAHHRIPSPEGFGRVSVIPQDAEAFARALYAELHACDDAGAGHIVVEAPPGGPEWRAIADRLKRAAAK